MSKYSQAIEALEKTKLFIEWLSANQAKIEKFLDQAIEALSDDKLTYWEVVALVMEAVKVFGAELSFDDVSTIFAALSEGDITSVLGIIFDSLPD